MDDGENDFYLSRSNFIKCKEGNISDFYDISKKVTPTLWQELGKGAYGTVFSAKLKNS